MKYSLYKGLTVEEKEEYNYKVNAITNFVCILIILDLLSLILFYLLKALGEVVYIAAAGIFIMTFVCTILFTKYVLKEETRFEKIAIWRKE